jgi:hypothetical protein
VTWPESQVPGAFLRAHLYADCTCSNCDRHRFTGLVLGGVRYFQAKDLNPDHPLLDRVLFEGGETVRENPDILVARR